MALILIDALPSGQALINTDQIVQARLDAGRGVIHLRGNQIVLVPHENLRELLDDIQRSIEAEQSRTTVLPI